MFKVGSQEYTISLKTTPLLNACQIQLGMTPSCNHMVISRHFVCLKGCSLIVLQFLFPKDQMGSMGLFLNIS